MSSTSYRPPTHLIRDNKRVYVVINIATYGLLLTGFVVGLAFPSLRDAQRNRLVDDGTADLVRSLLDTPWLFALTIFAVNVVQIGVLTIALPSMVVPFLGIPLFAYWTFTTGVGLVAPNDLGWVALIPHTVTIVVEFQAYIVLLTGAYLLGDNWIRPHTVGATTRREGYRQGLRRLGRLAYLAVVPLVVGAVYEAFSLRYLVRPLADWLL
jgi:hypothetical protein